MKCRLGSICIGIYNYIYGDINKFIAYYEYSVNLS